MHKNRTERIHGKRGATATSQEHVSRRACSAGRRFLQILLPNRRDPASKSPLGEALDNAGLSDPRLADKNDVALTALEECLGDE